MRGRPGTPVAGAIWRFQVSTRTRQARLLETVRNLGARGVEFTSLQEQLDTTTVGGKLIFHSFAAVASFERDLIRERTNPGLVAAQARGRKGGRPKGVDQK